MYTQQTKYKAITIIICILMCFNIIQSAAFEVGEMMRNNPLFIGTINQNGFDIVFSIDNSLEMNDYDYMGDNGWLDSYAGLMEQAPEGSKFSVVTKDSILPLTDIKAAATALYEMPLYTGVVEPLDLLQSAVNEFENSNKQKIIVLSNATWYNKSELMHKISALSSQGIIVYLVAFEKDKEATELLKMEYENIIVCRDVKELCLNIVDLNAYLVEFKSVIPLQHGVTTSANEIEPQDELKTYKSAFKIGKHNFKNAVTENENGACLALLLNMYYLLPSYTDEYNLYKPNNTTDEATCIAVGKGNSYEMFNNNSGGKASFLSSWNAKADSMLTSNSSFRKSSNQAFTSELLSVVKKNLEMRIPIIISSKVNNDEEIYIITKYTIDGDNRKFELFSSKKNAIEEQTVGYFIDKNITIIDSSVYFGMIRAKHYMSQKIEKNIQNGDEGVNVTITLSREEQPCYITDDNLVAIPQSFTTDTVIFAPYSQVDPFQRVFVVGAQVKYGSDNLPDCYNSTMSFIIRKYVDVSTKDWYTPYVYDLTNKGYVKGYDNQYFAPESPVKHAEFLAIVLRAADLEEDAKLTTPVNVDNIPDEDNWAKPLLSYAKNKNWITTEYIEKYNNPISRELAAHMLWIVLASEITRTPHQLFEYPENNTRPQDGKKVSDFNDYINIDNGYKRSVELMFLNSIMVGYPDENKLKPKTNITRAETCKIVSKSLFSLNDMTATIDHTEKGEDIIGIKVGEATGGTLTEFGAKTYTHQTHEM